ncbi:hypothetical protein LGL08_00675 [Clostridium estertheticum]|uniref:hypothetical protein n=1 Tax=Clostridium estertheticum TaxID=238834 RepID=UPI001CF5DB93|nr:hypothetical protein [Clostridium estertheticum]MCB2305729.1 hypothetical protein [Clostridium estertheticum]MCB2347094.1 hypothetical protein [Clostridium estertheticum]MCB2348084.1 hypothetical protein [Clostridium estertheticum]WAG45724.1 hypothetical protein LL127_19765 [Clostridium estertheticum]
MKGILKKLRKYQIIIIFIIIILILLRAFFEYATKSKGLYLVHDYMYNILNYIILALALLVYFKNEKVRWTYLGVLALLIIMNTFGIYKSISTIQFQSNFIHAQNSFIIRETKDEPEFSIIYIPAHKIFMRLDDKIKVTNGYKPFVNKGYEVVWLNDDKALIKYLNGTNHISKGDILNFSKTNGPYSNVLANLSGTWIDKNNNKNTINIAGVQITYKAKNKIYWYSSSMSGEQGNYGSILYGNSDTPSIYILMNSNNTITVGYTALNNNEQSIYTK